MCSVQQQPVILSQTQLNPAVSGDWHHVACVLNGTQLGVTLYSLNKGYSDSNYAQVSGIFTP